MGDCDIIICNFDTLFSEIFGKSGLSKLYKLPIQLKFCSHARPMPGIEVIRELRSFIITEISASTSLI